MDGLPAPISRFASEEDSKIAREIVYQTLIHDFVTESNSSDSAKTWVDDMTWYVITFTQFTVSCKIFLT